MYHLYTTPAIVFGSAPFGEANRLYTIFTRELGLVPASAQGVRLLRSKLCPHLTDFACAEVTLVRGRERWRLVGARKDASFHEAFRGTPPVRALFARLFRLSRRLLPPEEAHPFLFDSFVEARRFALSSPLAPEVLPQLECVLALRVLRELGYLGDDPKFRKFLSSPHLNETLLSNMDAVRVRAIAEINKSLRETQL